MQLQHETTQPDLENIELADVLDASVLQDMMNDYNALTGIGIGIIDLKGNVLVGTGWQDICVQFHRAFPESYKLCYECDTALSSGVPPGTFKTYRCKNNMWDMATPIMLGDRHIGNIFLGQFLYDDEEPDYELFRAQARRFGYDETAYIAALDRVSRFSRETVQTAMTFYSKLAQMISRSNYSNIILADTLSKKKHAEQALQEKNSELESFTYTVSHDLKSPLITIQTYAGMIAKDMKGGNLARAHDDIKRIENAAGRMNSLLRDLLELSRIGRQMNEPSRIDMNSLVKGSLEQLAGPIEQGNVEVVVHPGLSAVTGDLERIAEVMQNLVENAVKYRGEASPRVEIGVRQDAGETVFFVADNGIGIEPIHHERIFGLFNKLDPASEGTGLGLALVRRIIELHGGRVWVESEGSGKGSRFCFTMPG